MFAVKVRETNFSGRTPSLAGAHLTRLGLPTARYWRRQRRAGSGSADNSDNGRNRIGLHRGSWR